MASCYPWSRQDPLRRHVWWLFLEILIGLLLLSHTPSCTCLSIFFLPGICKSCFCFSSQRKDLRYPRLDLPPNLDLVASRPYKHIYIYEGLFFSSTLTKILVHRSSVIKAVSLSMAKNPPQESPTFFRISLVHK